MFVGSAGSSRRVAAVRREGGREGGRIGQLSLTKSFNFIKQIRSRRAAIGSRCDEAPFLRRDEREREGGKEGGRGSKI